MVNYVVAPAGTGKSCLAAKLALQYLKKGYDVYSMSDIIFCKKITRDDFYKYAVTENCLILIDESGIEFGSRNWQDTPTNVIKFTKKHRHFKATIFIFSQEANDTDSKIRGMANIVWLIRPLIRFRVKDLTLLSRISLVYKYMDVDDKHDLRDMYFKTKGITLFFPLLHTHLFNTFEKPELPEKDWETYGDLDYTKKNYYILKLKLKADKKQLKIKIKAQKKEIKKQLKIEKKEYKEYKKQQKLIKK